MLRKSKKKEEPVKEVAKVKEELQKDRVDYTLIEIKDFVKTFKNEEVFVCLQDCLKKLHNIKKDHGN